MTRHRSGHTGDLQIEWLAPARGSPVPLEPVEVGGRPSGEDREPRRWVPAAVAVGAVLAVGVGVLAGSNDDGGEVAPTTVAAPTVAPSPDGPSFDSARPSTDRSPRTTTTLADSFVVPGAPLLGRPSGVVLYATTATPGGTWVSRIDLDTGQVDRLMQGELSGDGAWLGSAGPGEVFVGSYGSDGTSLLSGTERVPIDASGEPVAVGSGRIWLVDPDRTSVTLVDRSSGQTSRTELPFRAWNLVDDGQGGLLSYIQGGGTYRVAPGPPALVDTALVLAASAAGRVVHRCDEAAVCRLLWSAPGADDRVLLEGADVMFSSASIAPGDRHAVIATTSLDRGTLQLLLLDLVGGTSMVIQGGSPLFLSGYTAFDAPVAWSPDGKWFALLTNDGIAVWDVERSVLLDIDALDPRFQIESVALA